MAQTKKRSSGNSKRGFAAMSSGRQRSIASKGGRSSRSSRGSGNARSRKAR